jgi:hypothetical protein
MRSILHITCSLLTVLFALNASAQNLWSVSGDKHDNYFAARSAVAKPVKYNVMNVNAARLHQVQAAAALQENSASATGVVFEMPLPDGSLHLTRLVQTSIWQNKSVQDEIGIKTYSMFNPATRAFEGNITIWKDGISGIMFDNKGLVYVSPLNVDNSGAHMISYLQDGGEASLKCLSAEVLQSMNNGLYGRPTAGDCKARTYRLAVAATAEYTAWAGSVAQAKGYMTITMNNVTAIYKRDVNVVFSLIDNTNIIYTDATTDPYTTASAGLDGTALNQNQTAIDGAIGTGNYDVGIVFNKGWSGGLAQLNAVCTGSKARGAIGFAGGSGANPVAGPQGQWFDGAAAHELGHMFGATHSFSASNGACGSNATVSTSWEPGSGSTLMAYAAAGCGNTNAIQTYQDYYFHAGSIAQMENYIVNSATCATGVTTANVAPSASAAGSTFNIPANTPFMLKLTSTDANGDALTYSWEQLDAATATSATAPSGANTTGPMFRSLPPATSNTRYFPALSYLSTGTAYAYEVIPTVARTMNFRGTVRDNSSLGGCTAEANVTLNVQTSTGFQVTLPAWGTVWSKVGNNTASVQWDIAGTNTSPINCSQVDIFLSTDGGLTFPITLATSVPNTGSYNVLIPSLNTSNARVMVKGTNNVFFNIGTDNFIISDPMPVNFLYFKARKEGTTAILDWSTASESNSDKFIVERSSDGSNFSNAVGTVKAAGNSTTQKSYGLVDAFPMNKWNYYRVKEVDLDGKTVYSTTASVYFDKDKGSLISLYPNPVKNTTSLDFYSANGAKVNMQVYDSKGALIFSSSYMATVGFNRTSIDLSSLTAGIYTLKCYSEAEVIAITKLIKN